MNVAVVYSREDVAGSNIAGILRSEFGFSEKSKVPLIEYPSSLLYVDEQPKGVDLVVVASRHKSASGKSTLTTHVTGNWGTADAGGKIGELSIAPALYLRQSLLLLRKYGKNLPYEISLEVTHHGPTSWRIPLLFVEVGSTEAQWKDMDACRVAASVISDLVSNEPEKVDSAIGFGGPHYAPNFTECMVNVALGHIAPKHALEYVDGKLVSQMVEKTIPAPSFALFDWKGMKGEEKERIMALLGECGLSWKKTSDFKSGIV
ncbi:D-aminoacyl-tRNA deacylase [uncultured archaeon]|nr:D-aminoacyl-tRNA deacylase [uncultured archaeon]